MAVPRPAMEVACRPRPELRPGPRCFSGRYENGVLYVLPVADLDPPLGVLSNADASVVG